MSSSQPPPVPFRYDEDNRSQLGEARAVPEVLDPDSDHDSVPFDFDSVDGSTRSVRDSIFNFIKENGRTYHAYQAGAYLLPNDQRENERLDWQFEILKVLFAGRNYFAPLEKDKLRKVMDIGTGTGKWAIQIAKEFPDAEVTGTDLSPIQPLNYPQNCRFIIDDASEPDWMIPPNSLDYVHTRILLGAFDDFRDVINTAFKYTKPGGWMESQEWMHTIYCDDDTMKPDYPFLQWTRKHDETAMYIGKPMRIANKLKRWYEQAGFIDVHEEVFKLPLNPWPKDPQYKLLGRFAERNMQEGIQGFSMAFFHRVLGWTKDEIEVYLVNARKSIADKNVHAYHKIFVVWGRKPYPHEVAAKQQQQAHEALQKQQERM